MAELSHPWDAYASYQNKLSKRWSVDDFAWGLESGLDKIVTSSSPADAPRDEELVRVIASGARRHRYGTALIAKFVATVEGTPSYEGGLEARSDLRCLQRVASAPDFRVLVAVGLGENQALIADREGLAAPALRARLSRARAMASIRLAA